ncbi:hypothetical protein HMPREF1981_00826 [Bacteroides pyogenes F0041]|uniref:Uncharacterized protein n=1 Tax=Bacteroides pyogenes F0041 TaxID=1321819 RepID=U2CPX8_9BACE|nr:hypothetical protein HMPREF1981_00826 [Bacteroides pyogenes F0041]
MGEAFSADDYSPIYAFCSEIIGIVKKFHTFVIDNLITEELNCA